MAKFLVGSFESNDKDNIWNLPDALEKASDGDTIELQSEFNYIIDKIISIDKNINIVGNLTGENNNLISNTISNIQVEDGCEVTIQNVKIISNIGDTTALHINNKSKVNLDYDTIVAEESSAIRIEDGSNLVLKKSKLSSNDNIAIDSSSSKLEVYESTINSEKSNAINISNDYDKSSNLILRKSTLSSSGKYPTINSSSDYSKLEVYESTIDSEKSNAINISNSFGNSSNLILRKSKLLSSGEFPTISSNCSNLEVDESTIDSEKSNSINISNSFGKSSNLILRKSKLSSNDKMTIYSSSSKLEVYESTISAEKSNAITIRGYSNLILRKSKLSSSKAPTIFSNGSKLEVYESTISAEKSNAIGILDGSKLILRNSKLSSSKAPTIGSNSSKLEVDESTISSEKSNAITIRGDSNLILRKSKLSSSEIPTIGSNSSKLEVDESTISAEESSAICIEDGSNLILRKSKLSSSGDFPTISSNGSKLEVDESTISPEKSNAISIRDDSKLILRNSKLSSIETPTIGSKSSKLEVDESTISSEKSNAITIRGDSNLILRKSKLSSSGDFPTISSNGSKLEVDESTIYSEKSVAIIIRYGSNLILRKSKLSSNDKMTIGSNSSKLEVNESTIRSEKSNAISIRDDSNLILRNSNLSSSIEYPTISSNSSKLYITDFFDIDSISLVHSNLKSEELSIKNHLFITNESSVNADLIGILGVDDGKVNFFADNKSNIKIDKFLFGKVTNPNIKLERNVEFDVNQILYAQFDAENSNFIFEDNFLPQNNNNIEYFGDEVIVKKPHEKNIQDQPHDDSALGQLHEMIGLNKLKEQVDTFIEFIKFNEKREEQGAKISSQSLHSLFLGNPGTGKTTVARIVGKVMYENGVMPTDKYVEVTRQGLVGEHVGETAIKTEEVLESALGGVLFIDEAYTLYQEGSSINWGQEAVDTILKYMEDHRNEIMIIFAGYTKEMEDFINMNPGLASRVPNVFDFEDYTSEEIAQIGIMSLHNQDYEIDEEYYKKAVIQKFKADIDHSNGRWIRNFNEKLIQKFVMSLPDDIFKIPNSVIDELTGGDQDSKNVKVDQLLKQLNSMVGLNKVKQFVNDLVKTIKVEQKMQDQLPDSTKPTYHMVFSGSPGTGKTTVARIIAELFYNLGILPKDTVTEVSRPDLVGRYVGETEEKTGTVIRNAMGGVLFVDEAYQLTANSDNDFGKQAIETFITELENNRDKFVAIFAGYTEEMESFLDANAGLRSRIPLTIEFEDYTPEEIAQIVLLIVTKNWTVNEELLKTAVANSYCQLPDSEKSNGRWARNFADKLISKHKLWLGNHSDEDLDVTHIDDDLLTDSISW